MAASPNGTICRLDTQSTSPETARENGGAGKAHLLLEAFQTFTQASNSLETAFQRLQARTLRLSQELSAKNRELKKSLREKEEVQNHLARILESLPCGVLVVDKEERVTLCNSVAARILGLSGLGRGRTRRKAHGNAGVQKYLEAFADRESGRGEVEIPFPVGGSERILAASSTPLKNAAGVNTGTLHIIRDISDTKAIEAQSKRGERLAAMGEMAVELAHEIRNPLGSIELFASLLEKELPRQSDPGRWAENIRIGSRSLNNTVSNMLHFANPLAPHFRDVNLHELVREILSFADPILQQRQVRVETRLHAHERAVVGDRELLKQMFLNLVLNSLQAMPSRGSLTLGTRDVNLLPGGARCDGVELTIKDTGLGIPPENLARVFDPLFTTNKNGTGLGLSVVHQIVEQHAGFIHVESEVNVGTTFTIVLPGACVDAGAA